MTNPNPFMAMSPSSGSKAGSKPAAPEQPAPSEPERTERPPENPAAGLPSRSKLDDMRKADLQALADSRGVGYDKADTRDDLIDALEADAGRV